MTSVICFSRKAIREEYEQQQKVLLEQSLHGSPELDRAQDIFYLRDEACSFLVRCGSYMGLSIVALTLDNYLGLANRGPFHPWVLLPIVYSIYGIVRLTKWQRELNILEDGF